jgi:uncharacterized protein YdiU (UPF0061 family)
VEALRNYPHRPLKYTGGQDESKDGIPIQMERINPILALVQWSIRQVVKAIAASVSVSQMGVRCNQKPTPRCNVWDMQTGYGSDVRWRLE